MQETYYEWDLETVDDHGDILDHEHADSLKALPAPRADQRLVLIRDVYDPETEDHLDRQWAYADERVLPTHFDGGATVPTRFHREIAQGTAQSRTEHIRFPVN